MFYDQVPLYVLQKQPFPHILEVIHSTDFNKVVYKKPSIIVKYRKQLVLFY